MSQVKVTVRVLCPWGCGKHVAVHHVSGYLWVHDNPGGGLCPGSRRVPYAKHRRNVLLKT